MAEDGGSSQPPPSSSIQPNAPKAAVVNVTSSFINKSGKPAAAPKAVRRRRPGAGAVVAPAAHPSPAPSSTAEPLSESHSGSAQTVEAQAETQLSTPAATQEVLSQDIPQTDETVSTPIASAAEPSTKSTIPSAAPSPTPLSIDALPLAAQEKPVEANSPRSTIRHATPRLVEGAIESAPSPKRRRVELAGEELGQLQQDTFLRPTAEEAASPTQKTDSIRPNAAPTSNQPAGDVPHVNTEINAHTEALAGEPRGDNEITQAVQQLEVQSVGASQRPKRKRLPWVSVNVPQDEEQAESTVATMRQKRAKVRGMGKATMSAESVDEGQEGGEEEEPQSTRRRPGTKGRSKKKAGEEEAEGDAEAGQRAVRKTRKVNKAKRKTQTVEENGEGENGDQGEVEGATEAEGGHSKKGRRTRKKVTEHGEDNANGEKTEQQPIKKGRSARAPTPSDAENEVIDEEATFMDSLASRDVRVGKLSEREKKMRQINWAEVKQRRREAEAQLRERGRRDQDTINQRLDEAGNARNAAAQRPNGPQLKVVNGEIVMVEESGTIDREADADREIEMMEIEEEDDLTTRITHSSFLRNNKRFPEEFLLPGQGRRWNFKDTEDFYRALQMFGTDFMMISTLFPGTTRRSVKNKFVREERLNPTRIKETLHGRMNSNWAQYLAESGRQDDAFLDPDAIKRELDEERRHMEVRIKEAKAVVAEDRRQRRFAGMLSDDENAGHKEHGKGKKKRNKGKEKQVTFEPEEGVEVLGGINEDDTWGRE